MLIHYKKGCVLMGIILLDKGEEKNILVREEQAEITNHDRLFKQLIGTFFEECLEALFPTLHDQIDFEIITHLSEETYTYDGDRRILERVAEVKWKVPDDGIVVHVEPPSYLQKDFNVRMFKHYGLLYNKLNKPIIPIAIFSYDEGWDKDHFTIDFGDITILQFNYLTLHVRKQNWHQFIKQENPVSAALLSKMDYNKKERIQVKLEFFKILARLKFDMQKEKLLVGFFESYLTLNEEEEATFMKEARKLDNAEEVLEITVSYEEKGREKGREEGLEEGLEEGIEKGLEKG